MTRFHAPVFGLSWDQRATRARARHGPWDCGQCGVSPDSHAARGPLHFPVRSGRRRGEAMESARQKFGIAKIRYRLGVRSSFEANRTRAICKIAPATSLRCCRWRPVAMMIPLQPPGPTSVSARSRLAKQCFASGYARPARTLALRALRLRLCVHLQLLLRCASHIQRKGGTNPKDESELNRARLAALARARPLLRSCSSRELSAAQTPMPRPKSVRVRIGRRRAQDPARPNALTRARSVSAIKRSTLY